VRIVLLRFAGHDTIDLASPYFTAGDFGILIIPLPIIRIRHRDFAFAPELQSKQKINCASLA
jgi:hypothetical protein